VLLRYWLFPTFYPFSSFPLLIISCVVFRIDWSVRSDQC
jgi:hypothetical protein